MIYLDLPTQLRCDDRACKLAARGTCEFRVEGNGYLRFMQPKELPEGWRVMRWVPGVLSGPKAQFSAFCPIHAPMRLTPDDQPERKQPS